MQNRHSPLDYAKRLVPVECYLVHNAFDASMYCRWIIDLETSHPIGIDVCCLPVFGAGVVDGCRLPIVWLAGLKRRYFLYSRRWWIYNGHWICLMKLRFSVRGNFWDFYRICCWQPEGWACWWSVGRKMEFFFKTTSKCKWGELRTDEVYSVGRFYWSLKRILQHWISRAEAFGWVIKHQSACNRIRQMTQQSNQTIWSLPGW